MKTSSKTSKRRLKKSVRRTIGGICLASAIMVAAIPFPEAEAYNPAVETIPPYDVGVVDYEFNYPDLDYPSNTDFTDTGSLGGSVKRATVLAKNSANQYSLDWQYEYWLGSGGGNGYITDYNSQYQNPTVELESRVYSDYVYISEADMKKFNTDTTKFVDITINKATPETISNKIRSVSYEYVLDNKFDDTDDTHLWLQSHFPDEVAAYNTAYDLYVANAPDPDYPKPATIIKTLSDFYTTYESRKQYLCDTVFGGSSISLVDVQKRLYEADGVTPKGTESVFVVKLDSRPASGTSDINGEIYQVDANGFLCSSYDVIVGIGKNAFNGVGNVGTIVLPPEVSFIGDSAFEGCGSITSISLPMDAKIGNRAFYGCPLSDVEIGAGTRRIGAEAFYGSQLSSITIPDSCTYIGPGAFADSASLSSVSFADGSTSPKEIGKFAFFNDLSLNDVDFNEARVETIGKAAFAIKDLETSPMTSFTFPSYVGVDGSNNTKIGPYCLAGRGKLEDVYIPDNTKGKLNDTIFFMCTGLGSVTFGEQCYDMTFNSDTDQNGSPAQKNTMFYTVTNPNFYVRGPELNAGGSASSPRTSTWKAAFDYAATGNVGRPVPYVYTGSDGKDYYEISDNYLMVIDKETGTLVSCTFPVGTTPADITNFEIPAYVGDTQVNEIAPGCFEDRLPTVGVLDYIVNLIIPDGSGINSIGENTFKGADKLATVDLGNSVRNIDASAFEDCGELTEVTIGENITAIGDAAFQNCTKLENVYFDIPYGENYSLFPEGSIGENAFNMNGDKLTIHGAISPGYAPFEWATDSDNFANRNDSIRTLYKTPVPSGLSVILDNGNGLVTLVDYPHYDELDTVIYDVKTGEFIELDTAPSASSPEYTQTIKYKLDNNIGLNDYEQEVIRACREIVIPSGVESIDAYGFFNDSSKNPNNVTPLSNRKSAEAYYGTRSTLPFSSYNNIGLFNGYYGDEVGLDGKIREFTDDAAGQEYEKVAKGNDRITSVKMNDVVYLPDNAFDSCENLESVSLGRGLESMGALPFSGCINLSQVLGNNNFDCDSGIVYQNNTDGTLTIVECLESRGLSAVGRITVSADNDPKLSNVKDIRKQAFKDCKGIYTVDLSGANQLIAIPEECFIGCEKMTEILVPKNVNRIEKRAFADTGYYTKVTVKNPNLYLEDDTNDNIDTAYYVTYKDALSRIKAEEDGYIVDQTLDDVFIISYYDRTGKDLLGTEPVVAGEDAKGLDESLIPVVDGMVFDGWHLPLKNITKEDFRLATYKPIEGNNSSKPDATPTPPKGDDNGGNGGNNGGGNNGGGNNGGNNGGGNNGGSSDNAAKYRLTVNYGAGSGDYAAGLTVIIEAIDPPAGKVFDKWVVSGNATPTITSTTSKATTLKMPAGDCTVTATYKDASSKVSTGGSSRTDSGTPGGNGSGNGNTRVDIYKPGISNTDKAYASVKGTTDNFVIKITEDEQAANLVATALANKYGDMTPIKYFAMDISLYDSTGTQKITNTNGITVNVTMPLPDAMVQYAGNNRVGAVNGTVLEDLACKFVTVDGIPCVSFTATHFSPYTIYVDTNNLTYGTMDSTPKTGDGIHPKWFASLGLFSVSMILFFKRDRVNKKKTIVA